MIDLRSRAQFILSRKDFDKKWQFNCCINDLNYHFNELSFEKFYYGKMGDINYLDSSFYCNECYVDMIYFDKIFDKIKFGSREGIFVSPIYNIKVNIFKIDIELRSIHYSEKCFKFITLDFNILDIEEIKQKIRSRFELMDI